jgi:hypothetical protein
MTVIESDRRDALIRGMVAHHRDRQIDGGIGRQPKVQQRLEHGVVVIARGPQ